MLCLSQGKPGAPGKWKPKQRPVKKYSLQTVQRSKQSPGLLKQSEGQEKVGTSFLIPYTLYTVTECPHLQSSFICKTC